MRQTKKRDFTFARSLEGEGEALDEWIISRILEEGLAGSVIDAYQQPLALCLDILDLRAFARTKAAIDGAERMSDIPAAVKSSPYYKRVTAVIAAAAREALARRRA